MLLSQQSLFFLVHLCFSISILRRVVNKVSTKNFHSRLFHSQIFHEARIKTIHGKVCTVLECHGRTTLKRLTHPGMTHFLRLDHRDRRQAQGFGNSSCAPAVDKTKFVYHNKFDVSPVF